MNEYQTTLPEAEPTRDSTTLEGILERVVFVSDETGWSVVRLSVETERARVTAVGNLHGAQPGENLRLTGKWVRDARYGRQFRVESFLALQPSTLDGIRRFLGSGLVAGIGPAIARRLVERFGIDTLEIIEDEPERLTEVAGIGAVRCRSIRQAYGKQRELRDAMVFLQSYGISPRLAVRICQHYGESTIAMMRENPFRLADEMFGVGFKTADRVAGSLGFERTSPERVRAGLLHTLSRAANDGNVYLPQGRLLATCTELLGIDRHHCALGLEGLLRAGELVFETPENGEPLVYLPDLHRAETGVAESFARLLTSTIERPAIKLDVAIEWFERREGIELAERQKEAIRQGLTSPVVVITGGPGTGKTTLVRAITEVLRRKGQRLELTAPTGRAAKRLGEATGLEARTIHRLLEYDPRRHGFLRGPGRPIEADTLIVDELSMIDCPLAHLLLRALPVRCRLILLGDADQLPSVGPGRVLHDLIASHRVPVVHLTDIFRQARTSHIVRNAHLVNQGKLPLLDDPDPDSDFFFIDRREPEEVLETVLHLVTDRIPSSFGFDALSEIQVLTPMRRGLLGTASLNQQLQMLLNPAGEAIHRNASVFRLGDRVMQIRNNYELGVFNGDVGLIGRLDVGEQTVSVLFGHREVAYSSAELADLTLAYACSIHKSQGSEYPCVVIPVHSQHHVMLQRNLLYTALTRAKRLAVLVGTRKAIATAVRNHLPQRRFTRLSERLAELVAAPK